MRVFFKSQISQPFYPGSDFFVAASGYDDNIKIIVVMRLRGYFFSSRNIHNKTKISYQ